MLVRTYILWISRLLSASSHKLLLITVRILDTLRFWATL